jgi:flagellar hook capping protein FlgD
VLRVQRIVGVVLVLGLLAGSGVAFAVAQSLKSEPARVVSTDFSRARAFSPGCDCGTPKAAFSLKLSGSADLSVRITNSGGRVVRQMLDHRRSSGVVPLTWDGTDAKGRQVPDGSYQVQVRFARGRWRAAPNAVITVDTRPPVVTAQMPGGRTIAYGAQGDDGIYRYTVRSDEPGRIWPTVFRVLPDGTVEQVWRPAEPVPIGAGAPVELTWPAASGTPDTPADDGTYLVGYEMRDEAGNVVRLPASFDQGATGTAAVVRVRALEITPSHVIGTFDDQVRVAQQLLTTSLPGTQVGAETGPPANGVPAPPSRPGLYGLRVSGSTTTVWGLQPVAGRAGTLVVLPTYTWQLGNPYDADADGFPDLAPAPLGLDRPVGSIARDGLDQVLRLSGGAMAAAGRTGAITDQQVDQAGVPSSARLLLVPAMRVWTRGLVARLRAFLRRGGHVALIEAPLDRRGVRSGGELTVAGGHAPVALPGATRGRAAAVRAARAVRRARAARAASARARSR